MYDGYPLGQMWEKMVSRRNCAARDRLIKIVHRMFLDRHAVSVVVSNVILTTAVVTLGLTVLVWTYSRSSAFNSEYADVVDENLARIKEKLIFEYVFHDRSGSELEVYLMNCGTVDDMCLVNVYVSNNSWLQQFSDIDLRFLNDTSTSGLDVQEEGYFKLTSLDLVAETSYSIRVITERGRWFDATFIA